MASIAQHWNECCATLCSGVLDGRGLCLRRSLGYYSIHVLVTRGTVKQFVWSLMLMYHIFICYFNALGFFVFIFLYCCFLFFVMFCLSLATCLHHMLSWWMGTSSLKGPSVIVLGMVTGVCLELTSVSSLVQFNTILVCLFMILWLHAYLHGFSLLAVGCWATCGRCGLLSEQSVCTLA